jgi:hypothetical protein
MRESDVQQARDPVFRCSGGSFWLVPWVVSLVCGCTHPPKPTEPTSRPAAMDPLVAAVTGQPSYVYQEVFPGDTIASDDALRTLVEVIRISAPMGSLSGNPAFWQATSDRTFSPEQQQYLSANGMRFATIEASAWPSLKSEIERHAGVSSRTSTAHGTGRAEIEVRSVPSQTLFFFGADGRLQGRSFADSDNFWGLRFVPDPAQRGKISLEICPVVRSSRRETRVTRRNNDYEIDYAQAEAVYELGMQLSLPVGMALVMAPTSAVRAETNVLGRAFLTAEDPAGLMEYILVLYPRLYRLNAKLTQKQFEDAVQREKLQLAQPAPSSSPQ